MINSVESGQQKEMMSAHNPTFTLSFSTKEAIVFSNDRYTPRPPAKTSEQAANRRAAILKAGIQPFCIQGIPVEQRWLQKPISQLEDIPFNLSRKEDLSDQFI